MTTPIRGPSKRRYFIPAMAVNLVHKRLLVQDLLQLPVPEGLWLDSFSGCWRLPLENYKLKIEQRQLLPLLDHRKIASYTSSK